MKNFTQLYLCLLAAATVGQSLAADMSPPLFVRRSHMMASGLEKRAGLPDFYCPAGSYMCASGGCCDIGTQCLPNNKCDKTCGPGSTLCGDDSCCDAGFACQGPNQPCLKVDSNTMISSMPMPTTNTMSKPITTSAPTTPVVSMPGTTRASSSTTGTPIPTMPKATTSSTPLVNPYPTMPSTTVGKNSTNSTVSANPGSSSLAVVPLNGGNSLQPAGWLGGFGMALFLVFFHM